MSLDISLETEARVKDQARRQGISVEVLLERLIGERGASSRPGARPCVLPVWHLGGVGSLHRRDIYDDAD
jgi:hypothetical protein